MISKAIVLLLGVFILFMTSCTRAYYTELYNNTGMDIVLTSDIEFNTLANTVSWTLFVKNGDSICFLNRYERNHITVTMGEEQYKYNLDAFLRSLREAPTGKDMYVQITADGKIYYAEKGNLEDSNIINSFQPEGFPLTPIEYFPGE